MLAEGCTLGISFHFRLESLCRKIWRSCARVLWVGLESCGQCCSNRHAGVWFVGSYSDSVLWAFFRLATLNLRVDSCMFEMRFPMLAERLALGITLPFFLEPLWVKGCFSLVFWISAWSKVFFKERWFAILVLCCCDTCVLLVYAIAFCVPQCTLAWARLVSVWLALSFECWVWFFIFERVVASWRLSSLQKCDYWLCTFLMSRKPVYRRRFRVDGPDGNWTQMDSSSLIALSMSRVRLNLHHSGDVSRSLLFYVRNPFAPTNNKLSSCLKTVCPNCPTWKHNCVISDIDKKTQYSLIEFSWSFHVWHVSRSFQGHSLRILYLLTQDVSNSVKIWQVTLTYDNESRNFNLLKSFYCGRV